MTTATDLGIHEQIDALLAERDMSRTELAERLGVTKAAVSNMLGQPGHNFTVKTLERIAVALDADLEVRLPGRS